MNSYLRELLIIRFKGKELYIILFLTLFSLLLRFYLISSFPVPVFDEIYYVHQGNELQGESIFPSGNPPLGTFFISLGESIWGACSFGWRFFSVIFGTACIPCVYLLSRKIWNSSEIALTASTLITFDPMFFVMSRLALPDIYLCFFILLSALFLASGRKAMCAISLGFALCSKWLAVFVVFGLIFLSIFDFLRKRIDKTELCRSLFSFIILPPVIYLILCCVLYPSIGPEALIELHASFLRRHMSTPASAYLASPWWSWLLIPQYLPLGEKHMNIGGTVITSVMKLIEIPALLWAGVFAIIASAAELVRTLFRPQRSPVEIPFFYFCLLYFSWAFIALIPRATHFYYLLSSMPFLIILLSSALKVYLRDGFFFMTKTIYILYIIMAFFMLYPHLVGWL